MTPFAEFDDNPLREVQPRGPSESLKSRLAALPRAAANAPESEVRREEPRLILLMFALAACALLGIMILNNQRSASRPVAPHAAADEETAPLPPHDFVNDGWYVREISRLLPPGTDPTMPFNGPMSGMAGVDLSANGKWLLVVMLDYAWLIDPLTERPQLAIPGLRSHDVLALSPDGAWVAVGRNDGELQVWSVARQAVEWTSDKHFMKIHALLFTADSKRLVSGDNAGYAKVWDVASGERIGFTEQAETAVLSLALTADGTRLYTSHGYSGKANVPALPDDVAYCTREWDLTRSSEPDADESMVYVESRRWPHAGAPLILFGAGSTAGETHLLMGTGYYQTLELATGEMLYKDTDMRLVGVSHLAGGKMTIARNIPLNRYEDHRDSDRFVGQIVFDALTGNPVLWHRDPRQSLNDAAPQDDAMEIKALACAANVMAFVILNEDGRVFHYFQK